MKWMCYGAGLLVAIMAGIAKRMLGAELPSHFMRSAEGSLLQGVGWYVWGAHTLEPAAEAQCR